MKLNKAIRTVIFESVMASTDFPALKQSIKDRTCALARELIAARVPAEFNDVVAAVGKNASKWFSTIEEVYIHEKFSPLSVLNSGDGFTHVYVRFSPIYRPYHFETGFFGGQQENFFADLRKEAEGLAALIKRTEGELRAFLASCTTTEKLVERMPEIEPHIPKTAMSYPIVASTATLTSYLLKAGFDTNVQKVA